MFVSDVPDADCVAGYGTVAVCKIHYKIFYMFIVKLLSLLIR